jgi:thioredoxin 1
MIYVLLQTQCPCTSGQSRPLLLLALIAGTGLVLYALRSVFRKAGASSMNRSKRMAIIAILAAAVTVVIIARQKEHESPSPQDAGPAGTVAAAYSPEQLTGQGHPTLIELGSDTCIPCKRMAPILAELKTEYAGIMDVHFLDVHKNPEVADLYSIQVIPTQIFYDASGKERFRHRGYFAKEDILAKWQELGVDLAPTP